MDREAYDKVKRHIVEISRAHEVQPEPPPPETNIREWAQARMRTKQREIDKIRRLMFEPKKWSRKEQEAVAEIAASNQESTWDRSAAIHLLSIWKMKNHASLLVQLLEDPQTPFPVRFTAASTLGNMGYRDVLPLVYDVAMSAKVPPQSYTASLYDACVQAMFSIVSELGFIDEQKYDPHHYSTWNETCRRWWEDTQPTEQMILAWSQGRQPF